ncbi:MAG TPA: FAD-dependent oxidoreductase [Thermoanaerobaculia bacterium]|nr:FAD-dependent oxidoreductase [Thermoanaerobaculia bacterium]
MTRRPDAVVVGAGIVGAACALALAREGLRVLVLEGGFAGGGATAAAMGHLVVMDDSEAQFALTAWSLRLWAELAGELPADCEDDPCGTLWLAAGEAEMERVAAKAAFYRARGVAAEILDAAQLAAAEPRLRGGLAGALRVPGDRVIYPPNVVRFLLARAADHGAELWERFWVSRVAGGVVEGHGERIAAPLVINAAGAAAPALTPGLPIVPRKGHLVITDRHPGFCRHQLVELGYLDSAHGRRRDEGGAAPATAAATTVTAAATTGTAATPKAAAAPTAAAMPASVAFNVQPRATGQVLIGSSRELVGWDRSHNHGLERRMLVRALDFLPRLAGVAALRGWIGFRPATPDNLPRIGPWPEVPGLWIAGGHEGLGITTSLATARLLADLVTGRRPEIDAAPFAPDRWRAALPGSSAIAGAAGGPSGGGYARLAAP